MSHSHQNQQLYWSLSKPLKYMGLTLDEWGVTLVGVVPGIVLLNSGHAKLGLFCMFCGIGFCYSFKKFKKVSQYFLLKSFLVAKKILPAPISYPGLLGKKVGK
ncbi:MULTISPECIES: hypothetical protein [spotted fever group]|uniref:Uncharacterized protein n=1 Tax=Rickettsia tamurae subsp. buchneri TaxID=1462938 RepID=A0A8E1C0D3_9RICK|nr:MULTISPECIES: hypothetical protein [spotted fever group]KDO02752.1 hypothetical protein REISMN_05285 [Rickettsia tamurae subsp. buchneri]KDO03381.1 hypothetical protein REISMN_01725 [Rickettsia tamurae subsp. buchneri]